ncbi:MAG: hypothetical protein EBR34_05940 [Sphingomonadaceae bacterium]|nr:hypothetical protein [Sphingomonadaceae bacterium]
MIDLSNPNLLIFAGALVFGLLLVWYLFSRASAPRARSYKPDVLDEGAAPAARNQALIDAPPAAQVEPPVVAPAPEPVPVAAPAPVVVAAPPPPAPAAADDLGRIKGLGPKLQKLLPDLGISTFAQIAALTEADLAALDSKLGAFAGRPAKDNWVEQAKFLAAGDTAGFEGKFGKV